MATIRKRGTSWQAIVKRKGLPIQRKNFKTKATAAAWARKIEGRIDDGSFVDIRDTRSTSPLMVDILDAYLDSYKRLDKAVATPKLSAINGLKSYFAGVSIHDLVRDDVIAFATMRRKTVNASTLQKQLTYLQAAVRRTSVKFIGREVERALTELSAEKIMGGSKDRERRLQKDIPAYKDRPAVMGEYKRIQAAAKGHKWIMLAVDLALATGMRMGEIHSLRFANGVPLTSHTVPFGLGYIDLDRSLIGIWRKNIKEERGKKFRIIPLFKSARDVLLRGQDYFSKGDRLFKCRNAGSIGDKFAKVRQSAGIVGLTFHDLRHEATSRMFEKPEKGGRGMSAEQVIIVTGHASLEELQTYVNLHAEDLLSSEDMPY